MKSFVASFRLEDQAQVCTLILELEPETRAEIKETPSLGLSVKKVHLLKPQKLTN